MGLKGYGASLGNFQSHVTNSSPAGIEVTDSPGNRRKYAWLLAIWHKCDIIFLCLLGASQKFAFR